MPARVVLALGICVANAADQYPGFRPFQKNKYSHPLITPEVQRLFETPIGEGDETPGPKAKQGPQEMKNPWMRTGNSWAAAAGRSGWKASGTQTPTQKPTVDEEKVVKIQEKDTCTFREREVLKPVLRLSTRITGSVSSNSTVKPQMRPIECQGAVPMARLRSCFFAAGFTKPTADCWAQEQFNMKQSCGGVCHIRKDPVASPGTGPEVASNMIVPGSPVYQLAEFIKGIEQVSKTMKSIREAGEKAESQTGEKVATLASAMDNGMWGALTDLVTDTLLKGYDKGDSDGAVGEVKKMVAKIPERDLQSVIWSADKNRDGKVTTAEMAAAIQESDDSMVIDPLTGKFVERYPGLMHKRSLRQKKPSFATKLTNKLGRLMKLMGGEASPPQKASMNDEESPEEPEHTLGEISLQDEMEDSTTAAPKKMQFPGFPGWGAAGQAPAFPGWGAKPANGNLANGNGWWTAPSNQQPAWWTGAGRAAAKPEPAAHDEAGAQADKVEDPPKAASVEAEAEASNAAQSDDSAAVPVVRPAQGMTSFPCQHCLARLRQLRRTCVNEAMRISESCQSCQIEAYKFYDATCMMPCVNVFYKPEYQQRECRTCTDQYNEMMAQCGL